MKYKLAELVKDLEVTIKGDAECLVDGICAIQDSRPGAITFLTNSLYRKYLSTTQASVVILSEQDADGCPINAIVSSNPYYTYAKIAEFFAEKSAPAVGVHTSVVMGEDCEIHPSVVIGPHCVLGNKVKIHAQAVLGSGCAIGDGVEIGENTQLDARVVLYHKVKIGKRCNLMSGVVIGGDGFGFANQKGVWHKVPQLGSVTIGDDVDIGANTTIDRGAVEDTVVENGAKLDNQIMVGHNVRIGENTIIAGCVGIAGSTKIGKNCMIGGASIINGHLTIGDNVMITGGTGVSKSLPEPGIYSSGVVGVVTNQEFRKNNARFHRLESLMQRVKVLESTVKTLTESNANES